MLTAVVVAAGAGTRMGGENKVWRLWADHPVWWWALNPFADLCARGILVVASDRVNEAKAQLSTCSWPVEVIAGGLERWESSARGVALVDTEYCAIHDAARPLLSPQLIKRVYNAALEVGAAIPGLIPSDTVKMVADARVEVTLPRERVVLVQTPQIFRTRWLREAFQTPDVLATDDAKRVEQLGYPIAVVPGDPWNLKITTPLDWEWLTSYWEHR